MVQESPFGITLPMGFRFVPEDKELIKIMSIDPPVPYIIDANIYQHSPSVLTDSYPSFGDKEWYFYTSRDRKYPNGSRPDRAAGDGYWKAKDVGEKRIYDNNECIGFKNTLVFYQGTSPYGNKTNWIMHEYTANEYTANLPPTHDPEGTNVTRLDNRVMCRIYERKKAATCKYPDAETEATHESSSENRDNMGARKRMRIEDESTNRGWKHNTPEQQQADHDPRDDVPVQNNLQVLHDGRCDLYVFGGLEMDNEVYVDLETGEFVDDYLICA